MKSLDWFYTFEQGSVYCIIKSCTVFYISGFVSDSPNPVSYTHLDVYKRQSIHHAVKKNKCTNLNDLIAECNAKVRNVIMREVG